MQQSNDSISEELRAKIPHTNSPQDKARINQIWSGFDVNSNGYVSLAEVDKGLRDVLNLPVLFDTKPVLIRAFTAAKKKLKSSNEHGDNYVSKAQFKYLLLYLIQYYDYWLAFQSLDQNNDRKVSPVEFKAIGHVLARWGIEVNNPTLVFKEIDANNGGYILFDQFCNWAIKKQFATEKEQF